MVVLILDRRLLTGVVAIACLLVPLSMGWSSLVFSSLSSPALALSPRIVMPAGTRIPIKSFSFSKILITKDETLALTLAVSTPLSDRQGVVVIPQGSAVLGELRPIGKQGSQFIAQKLKIISNPSTVREYPLTATSAIISRTELITPDTNTIDLVKQTLLGRAAATLLAEITGDRTLVSEIGEATSGIGLLAGWFLSNNKAELRSINPNRDLTLTLESSLTLDLPYQGARQGI